MLDSLVMVPVLCLDQVMDLCKCGMPLTRHYLAQDNNSNDTTVELYNNNNNCFLSIICVTQCGCESDAPSMVVIR